jgi:COMPASS component SPP1
MQSKINAWTDKGGKKEKLWDTVKTAKKRQGTVIAHNKPKDRSRSEISRVGSSSPPPSQETTIIPSSLCSNDVTSLSGPLLTSNEYVALTSASSDAAVKKLNVLLDKVVKMRNELVSAMNVIIWREKLLDLAKERAERVGTCGWDQRLCLGDDEVEGDFGTSVLESYDVDRENEENGDGDDQGDQKMNGVLTDGADGEEDEVRHGDWWCPGVVKCQRHAGWQALRTKDLALEKHSKEQALVKLTTRERDIRRRIEDTIEQRQHLYARKRGGDLDGPMLNGVGAKSVLKASSGANGRKVNGIAIAEKQEKKRKTLDD